MVKRRLLDHAGQCVNANEICREIGKKYDLLVDQFSEDEVL